MQTNAKFEILNRAIAYGKPSVTFAPNLIFRKFASNKKQKEEWVHCSLLLQLPTHIGRKEIRRLQPDMRPSRDMND